MSFTSNLLKAEFKMVSNPSDYFQIKRSNANSNESYANQSRIKHGMKSSGSLSNLSTINGIKALKNTNRKHGLHNSVISEGAINQSTSKTLLETINYGLINPIRWISLYFKNEVNISNIVKKVVVFNKQDSDACSLCDVKLMEGNDSVIENNSVLITHC
jgi:hypothetical protein